MKLVYEINRYGYWQQEGSYILSLRTYHSLESLQTDIHQNYNTRKMRVLEKDDENCPIKVQFETEDKNATKF